MEADEKFLKLFHNNLVGMICTDEDHRVTDINDHLLDLIGLERHEALGKTGIELNLLNPARIQAMWQEMADAGRLSNLEVPFVTPAGERKTLLLSTEKILIKGRPFWLSTILDISIKKQAEDSIADSELRFRTLAKTAPVGIFETDEKGNTIYVNEAWMEYSGLSFEEAMNNEWMNMIHPEDREDQINKWVERSLKGETSFSEYRIINKAGQLRWVNGRAIPLKGQDGTITGYIGTIADVTEIKQALEILKQNHDSLNERNEQLRDLSTYLQRVREDERAKIAREIHDELGQQLTGLKMDISWLKKKVGQQGGDDIVAKFDDAMHLIDTAVKSIRLIVTELRPSVIDDLGLNAAFEWQIDEFKERTGIPVQYKSRFSDSDVDPGSSIGLFRILQESLTNVARHASAKTVMVNIEKRAGTIEMVVQDDGVGFDTSIKQAEHSYGLLGIQERIYMMKGDFHIHSRPGNGTRINVSIPVS